MVFENLKVKYVRLQDWIKKNILSLVLKICLKVMRRAFGYIFFKFENSDISILKTGDNLSGIGFFLAKK